MMESSSSSAKGMRRGNERKDSAVAFGMSRELK